MLDLVPTCAARLRAVLTPTATAALLALAIAACAGAPPPGPTPIETPADPARPTPQGSPSPTISQPPTPSPAASPDGLVVAHPAGPTDVILRMEMGGGFTFPGSAMTQLPVFTLYGDGTFLLRPQEDRDRPDLMTDGWPRLLQGRMNEEYVQALLRQALGPGQLLGARDHYPGNCADCESTIFTIEAGGVSKRVVVDALSDLEEPGPDATERRAFAQLRETLAGLEQRARSGELGEVVVYDAELYRLVLMEAFGDPNVAAVEWPWQSIAPDDFQPAGEVSWPQAVLTREDVGLLLELPSGGHPGVWVEAPDGTLWEVAIRALLPDETPTEHPTED